MFRIVGPVMEQPDLFAVEMRTVFKSLRAWTGKTPATTSPEMESIVTQPGKTLYTAKTHATGGRDGAYFLRARLNVRLPALGREVAQAPADAAHLTRPYSKAVRNNVDTLITFV